MSERVRDFPAPEGPKSTDIPASIVKATSRSNSPIRRGDTTPSAGSGPAPAEETTPAIAVTAMRTGSATACSFRRGERVEDGERHRPGPALDVATDHQRRAVLTERAGTSDRQSRGRCHVGRSGIVTCNATRQLGSPIARAACSIAGSTPSMAARAARMQTGTPPPSRR